MPAPLLKAAALEDEAAEKLFAALQNKATTDISQLLARTQIPAPLRECLTRLPTLHGDIKVVREATALFKKVDAALGAAEDDGACCAGGGLHPPMIVN